MPPATVHLLVVSADPALSARLLTGFEHAAARLAPAAFVIQAVAVSDGDAAMATAVQDGDLHLVLIDHALRSESLTEPAAGVGTVWPAADLAQRLRALRPELSLYILLDDDDDKLAIEGQAGEALSGYFFRSEHDPEGWLRILIAEVAEKCDTPFFDQLLEYVASAKDSWHTPGHAGGDAFKGSAWVADFHGFVGEQMLRADLSVSVPQLDSLLHPVGVIAQAQDLAAEAFGARKTYFATNGTSTSNKVIFQTLLAPGDKLLLDRNCHKSVHHGVILSGARPVYLDSTLNRRWGIFGPVPRATVLAAIAAHPDAKVLILTSCTYDGLRYDLAPIIAAAHAVGIKVIVDEAWYGHARFHPELRPTALECGADYVTQSTHKVLSAFSQASMIHVNDPEFDEHLFRENFNMHASTSPQYTLIASLDVARKQAVMEGYKLLSRSLVHARELREKINATGVFRVLELDDLLTDEVRHDGVRLDPTKLTIAIDASGWDADELREELISRHNIQIEKNTHNTLTLLLTIATTRSKVSRLFDAMLRLAKKKRERRITPQLPEIPGFTRLACLPRDAFYEAGERIALLGDDGRPNPALVDRVCCDQIVPYPPGIPVLVAGQVISTEVLAYLARLLAGQKGIDLHGLATLEGRAHLRVLSEAETRRLQGRDGG
ncbi:MAG: ornithine decarboxylase [Burkholderiales bacterium]|nr:ornithine decarboxylase [Burkholderiales bacterium]